MNFTEIKQLVKDKKAIPSHLTLAELYCYYSVKALYEDYLNNRKDNKTIINELKTVEQLFNCDNASDHEKAIAHIGDTVEAKMGEKYVEGKIHSVTFFSRDKISVVISLKNGCTFTADTKSIIYKE